ncbi:MAG: hypothetical protein NTZ16_01685 [Verrucomicrobia bacterium]|nr:hypothetical protein [Verrucomicrobiota bacterium]
MNEELHIKLQAFLDGELPEAEAREVGSLIASDADAAALHRELKQTRAALAGFEKRITVPETREFYWSKIAREIAREAAPRVADPQHSVFSFWRRLFPVAGVVAALLAALVVINRYDPRSPVGIEVAQADSDAFTYRDYEAGTTLVWLSYPAENGLAQENTAGKIN